MTWAPPYDFAPGPPSRVQHVMLVFGKMTATVFEMGVFCSAIYQDMLVWCNKGMVRP